MTKPNYAPILILDPAGQWETLFVKGEKILSKHKISALSLLGKAEEYDFCFSQLIVFELDTETSEMLDSEEGWVMPQTVDEFFDYLNMEISEGRVVPRKRGIQK